METLPQLDIRITFRPEDLATLQASGATIPDFWSGHHALPMTGDLLSFGPWRCAVANRVWECPDQMPTLRLYMGPLLPLAGWSFH